MENALNLEVVAKTELADGIFEFELRSTDGAALPAFKAGAHLLIKTPAGVERRYSLCNDPAQTDRYCVAVKLDSNSKGGSASMVNDVQTGTVLEVGAPENYFALEDAQSYLLIAGGIGITPMRAMMAELDARGAQYRLIYCSRHPASTAFLEELQGRPGVEIHHTHGEPGRAFDFAKTLATRDGNQHIYCCGPRSLMQSVREGAKSWPGSAVHFEDFGTSEIAGQTSGGFEVLLKRSGVRVHVPEDKSILTAIRDAGIKTVSSCEAGTCGACKTTLCSGDVEHRDFFLEDEEYDTNIMICVSRAKSGELVIDL